jgi:uncharacterized protein YyaL (SSP411 family)
VKKNILFVLVFLAVVETAHALTNQLEGHRSAYLAMHGHDPVAWQEWNPQTLEKARQQNKLLFVSSGYFSCHWCHVMQRESFRHPVIARLLNQHFIPVKVDRELNASLDSRLIDFVEKTRGYAGWPLNVFITPQGHPLVGIVYLPAPDFEQLLGTMHSEWQTRAAELATVAAQASDELNVTTQPEKVSINKQFVSSLSQNYLEQALGQADEMQGGFGDQNKFPSVPQLDVLLDIFKQNREQRLENFLRTTLNQMASQGLRDQLGGGFYRYVVDPGWQIPHFEKMLYDNALLAGLYLKAARIFNNQDYEQIGRETLDFMLDEMRADQGAFIASLSAIDSNNVEGGYYLWTVEQLEQILSNDEADLVKEHWQVKGPADIEDGHHLVTASSIVELAKQFAKPESQINALLKSARGKMLAARQQRRLPLDRKKLAAWNGLALSALVAGARLNNDADRYHEAAQQLQAYLGEHFWTGNQLYRAVLDKPFGDAGLEDAAYLAKGMLDWAIYSGSRQALQQADKLIAASWERFHGEQGWRLNRQPLLKYKPYSQLIPDGPMPSPSASLVYSSLELASQLDNKLLKQKAQRHLMEVGELIREQPFWSASYIKAIRYQPGN